MNIGATELGGEDGAGGIKRWAKEKGWERQVFVESKEAE
jgi:hypothetical protein